MTVEEACARVVADCLAVRRGECVLILRDHQEVQDLHTAFVEAVREVGGVPVVVALPPAQSLSEVPRAVCAALEGADAVLLCTPWIFPHDLRRQALAAGARLLSLCGVTDAMLLRAAEADYPRLAEVTRSAAAAFAGAATLTVTTPAGTDIRARIEGRRVVSLDGTATRPGTASGLPAGVVAVTPVPGSAEGRLVLDGSIEGLGLVEEPATLTVEAGRVTGISGGKTARWLEAQWAAEPPGARAVAELGIGTNPFARYCGRLVEDERVAGSAHVGFGRNTHLGGEITEGTHRDAAMRRPTVRLDGRVIVREGELVL
jgi:leucyl aminopeptidase (aminopeptidase T)